MKIRFEWRELSEDGCLKTPSNVGPFYDSFNVNCPGGFETKDAAIERLEDLFSFDVFNAADLVLIEILSKN